MVKTLFFLAQVFLIFILPFGVAYSASTDPPESSYENSLAQQDSLAQRELIVKAQKKLTSLGYDAGPTDGIMGSKTVSALKEFQSSHGIEATGKLDELSQEKLFPVDVQVSDKENTPIYENITSWIESAGLTPSQLVFATIFLILAVLFRRQSILRQDFTYANDLGKRDLLVKIERIVNREVAPNLAALLNAKINAEFDRVIEPHIANFLQGNLPPLVRKEIDARLDDSMEGLLSELLRARINQENIEKKVSEILGEEAFSALMSELKTTVLNQSNSELRPQNFDAIKPGGVARNQIGG